MKKYSLFLLGALGLMMVACDEANIPESIPQENPQEPALSIGDITVARAGALAASTPLNLNDYVDDLEEMIPVLTLTDAVNVPEGADLSFELIMSNNDSFSKTYTLYPQYGETDATSKTLYVSAEDWNNAHLYVVGKNPKVQTVYYRIPLYVNVDGSDYRYGSTDYYILEGTLEEMCIDEGFVIEDAYYFLSNATTWDLGAEGDYMFYHDPDESVYDNPVFTYVFYQNGDNWWKIAPQSSYESGSWDFILGTELDGDDSESGVLTDVDPQAGKIPGEGKFEFKINMETMEYDVYPLAGAIYLVGAPQGWTTAPAGDTMPLNETEVGSLIYTGTYEIPAGDFMFRFYHALLDNWDLFSIGSQNNDASLEISFTNGIYTGPVYQEGVNATQGKGNWSCPDWTGGKIAFTVNLNDFTIEMKVVN